MSSSLTPSKRSKDGSFPEPNGKRKWQNPAAKSQNQSFKSSPGSAIFRVLCPDSKLESIVGNSGAVISGICQETGAKITVEEAAPGCDERVIVITASDKEAEDGLEKNQEGNHQEDNVNEGGGDSKQNIKGSEHKELDADKNSALKLGAASAQKALFLVFERLIEGDLRSNQGDEDGDKSPLILRLLILSGQVGCVLGKGGSVIKQMSTDSGAEIRILARDKLPVLASSSDELVQITGEIGAVRRALQSISQQLIENVTRDNESSNAKSSHSSVSSLSKQDTHHGTKRFGAQGASSFGSRPRGSSDSHPNFPPPEALSFRVLCNSDRVGGIIGKGGAVVKSIQQETGCDIKVVEGIPDSEDRIIVISGPAHPDDRVSPVQDAFLRVQNRILRSTPDNKESSVTARMLVSSNQIGCLLGKGGAVIAEMRKSTGAYIRILGKDQIPKCASENEEVVQVNGEYDTVHEALLQITNRLRHHFFRDAFPSIDHPLNPTLLDSVPPYRSFMGRRELSPPHIYSNFGPSFRKFDAGPSPHGAFHPHEDRPPFMHGSFRPGVPPHMHERRPWGPEGLHDGGSPMGFSDFPGGPPRRIPGFGGGNQPAIITSTTIEVVVPRSVVPSIYGEDGWSLKQVRQISDAKITITESKPGATETVIIISGTPEQTQAAQSLIQAFVMCEKE